MLDYLSTYPIDHVVFSVGYLKEQVISFVQSHIWPFRYDFAEEDTPLGTGGGIRLALEKCHGDKVFVLNGDTFFPLALDAMPFAGPVTVALKPMKAFSRYGAVTVIPSEASVSHTITAFKEKAYCEEGLINAGVYAIDRSQLHLEALPERFSFEKEVLEPMAAAGTLKGWPTDNYFIDIGIPEDYDKAQWEIPAWFAVQKASAQVLASDAEALFLDRDGVLNRHLEGTYVKNWADWEWMPGILQALPLWAAKFKYIVLVTNQRGVGKGEMTDADLARIHARMMQELLEAGGRIDLVLTCTAVSDDDPRRKPHPGMFREACMLLPSLDPQRCVMLGDSDSDEAFARNCPMAFIRLLPEAVS
jgi:D-glycero-alpha-D-manno-heptose 1-phosphate guanylyltransferase